MKLKKQPKPSRLLACVKGIGNCVLITGQQDPYFVMACIICDDWPHPWLAAQQPAGRLMIRQSDITAIWVD